MIFSMNEHRLIGRKSLGPVCDFLPALGMNMTSENRHFCEMYSNVIQTEVVAYERLRLLDSDGMYVVREF